MEAGLLTELAAMPMQRVPHAPPLPRCWELRDNLTFCDAACVAVAETCLAILLTADARLANAPGIRCEVELV